MVSRLARLAFAILVFSLPASAQDVVPAAPVAGAPATDTLSRPRLGLTPIDFLWPIDLRPQLAPARPDDRRPGQAVPDWLAARFEADDRRRAARLDTLRMIVSPMRRLPASFDARRFLARRDPLVADPDDELLRPPQQQQQRIEFMPEALAAIANLDIQIDGTGQIGSQWQSFDPCALGAGQRCNSSAVPTIKPDFQLRARIEGTISERVFIDVDFDQTREFGATNNLNVFYQGLPGEILEFAEVGEVTLPLPTSRFISSGIPAGNFGAHARARVGPLTVDGVLAEQDGSVESRNLTLDAGGIDQGVLQDFESVLDDAAFTSGQFYFVVDPRNLPGYPDINVTALALADAPAEFQPASPLKLYRHEAQSGTPQNVEDGVIQARAVAPRPPGADPALPDSAEFQGFFRPLVEGEDYIVHDSGLWVVLKSRTLDGEALAVTYITAAGDTVGDFNAEEIFREIANTGSGELPTLGLLRDPATHRPGGVTWEKEMHQVYRISSSDDIESGSIELTISQGPIESGPIIRTLDGQDFTFLQIFGLDEQPTDDRLDEGRIWRPENSGAVGVVTGAYLIFPTLEPFRAPPPIEALDGAPFPLADGDRNVDIYTEPIDQLRRSSFRYRLNLSYRARSAGRASSFSLGAIGIREGSERVTLDGILLENGRDYRIDYEIGQLEILRPGELFGGQQNPELDVRFEQKPIFQIQPTSILGLSGRYDLGRPGGINFVGLLQREGSVLTRPELGLEPGAVSLGGVSADLRFQPAFLDRAVNALPGISTSLPSTIAFDAEIAGSSPTTNRSGLTYVDDFEGSSRLRLGLSTRSWRFGSVVTRPDADGDDFLPPIPDLGNQLDVVWQAQYLAEGGFVQGPLPTQEIDPAINTLNPAATEAVLYVSISDAPDGETGWFSMTQVLSETGLDLTAVEFLEFYALTLNSTSDRISMIIDIGTVSEDALVADSLGFASGVGVLDQEADPLVGIWGNQDDTGLWSRGCIAEPSSTAYPLGDLRANCTNNNGREDTEDLNRDNFLNLDERYFRYVVPLNAPSRYLDRETGGAFPFNKYRIPLALPDLLENATLDARQNVKHIRITFTSNRPETIFLTRMEFSGSPWLKRAGTGNVTGLTGQTPGTAGQVAVGPISTTDAGYVSPPGISDQQAQNTDDLTFGTQPINEQSLRLLFEDVPPGERIEVFRRFTETPRNFLLYRQLRAWALPLAGEFGPTTDLRFYMRVGFDTENFYLYRSPLQDETGPAPSREEWLPERLVDFDLWIELRAEAERRLLDSGPLPPDSALVVWDVDVSADGDSTHAVVLSDRSRAPNLAAVREIALGVENVGAAAAGPGEVWIDDLRLGDAADQGGAAFRAGVDVALADVAGVQANVTRRNPFFRQLGTNPSYQSTDAFTTRAQLSFGRFLPASLGLSVPMTFQHTNDGSDPFFVRDADVLAERIPNLRTPSSSSTTFSVGLSRTQASGNAVARSTIDGLRLAYSKGTTSQTATQSETDGSTWNASAAWQRPVADVSVPLLPGFLKQAIEALPDALANSTILRNLKDLRFRPTPRNLALGSNLNSRTVERRRFTSSIRGADAAADPTIDRQYTFAPRLGVSLQPFPSLVATYDVRGVRDLVDPSLRLNSESGVDVLRRERTDFLGIGIGWQTSRSTTTGITYQPELASWFDTRLTVNTSHQTNRNPSYVVPMEAAADTNLVRDLRLTRDIGLDFDVRPQDFLTLFGVAPARSAEGFDRTLRRVWDRLRPLRLSWTRRANASYDRRDISPSFTDELVLYGFDRMRSLNSADSASSASRARTFRLAGGLQFGRNLQIDVNHARSNSAAFTQQTRRETREIEWPSIEVNWRGVPVPSFLRRRVSRIMLSGEWKLVDRETGTLTNQDRGSEALTRTGNIAFVFLNGFNLSYDLRNTRTRRTDASGFSQSDRNSHRFRATGTFAAPSWLSFVRNPLRLSADLTLDGNADCRELGGTGFDSDLVGVLGDGCVAHVDQSTDNLSITADTDFTGYRLGAQFQWVHRSSAVGTRQTSNQFNFNIFGSFALASATRELPSP